MKKSIQFIRGFTLIEILVVVAIISLLSMVVFASFNEARKRARDSVRIADLEQAKAAMFIYAIANKTFRVAGAGSGGQGWFSYKNGTSYPKSIAEELVRLDLLTSVLSDPLVPAGSASANSHRQYMNYFFNPGGATKGTCLFAQLERPNAEQLATMEAAPIAASTRNALKKSYFMNYASCT